MPLPPGLKAVTLARVDAEITTGNTPKLGGTGSSSSNWTSGLLGLLMFALAGFCFYLFSQNNTTNQ
ncbi:MAG: LPXTG-motif cell wall-anchored protein [Saprospiraceae bacterium]|jgi:LPXTG-motif cell wall-anchored protein